jgi:hypothetical protein
MRLPCKCCWGWHAAAARGGWRRWGGLVPGPVCTLCKTVGCIRCYYGDPRCGWCGVRLRWWQREHCRMCWRALHRDAKIPAQGGGPPCKYLSRWEDAPDGRRSLWMRG